MIRNGKINTVARSVVLLTAVAAFGCGESSTAPSDDFALPSTPVAWAVSSDTSVLFPSTAGLPQINFVSHEASALDLNRRATIKVSCTYSYGDANANSLPPTRSVGMELASGVFGGGQLPLIVAHWTPYDANSNPPLVWQVPTNVPWAASLSDSYRQVFMDAVKSKQGVKLYWIGTSGTRVDVDFDVRGLTAAAAVVESRCRK